MDYTQNGWWQKSIELKGKNEGISYKYFLVEANGEILEEWGEARLIGPWSTPDKTQLIFDSWMWPSAEEQSLYSSAFRKTVMRSTSRIIGKESKAKQILEFRIRVPRLTKGFQICLLGDKNVLGSWDYSKAIKLNRKAASVEWSASVDLSKCKGTISYKYGIFDLAAKKVVTLEEGIDRKFTVPDIKEKGEHCLRIDTGFRFPLGKWKGSGVSVPVFSLKSQNSWGIGEFPDLIPFIDWAKNTGMKMVQILPVNETIALHNWLDSYPYKSISVVALHPIFLNPYKMGSLKDKKKESAYEKERKKLNKIESVDYPAVMALKSSYFKLLFDQEKERFFDSSAFKNFFKENKDWLIPYAAYAFLRDKMGTPDFREWGDFKNYDPVKIEKLSKKGSRSRDDIIIHYFIQYHLDKQLSSVTEHARNKGVVLKGDIPIGISPNSVEAWTEPELFNLNGQAGAPPDDFAIKGQNWGFPTYNWDVMAKRGFEWWKNRLQKMSTYFDAYRIDHILGFFRIWEIPMHAVEGILGAFNPCLPLSADEIRHQAVPFNYDRMVNPYIRQHFLNELFGENTQDVIKLFLEETSTNKYRLKEAFNTQQKVNAYFLNGKEEEDLDDKNRMLRTGLFDLISNVIFLELGDDQWHPRVNMHFTRSYQELDEFTKSQLDKIYNDFYYHRHNDFWHQKGMEKLPAIISASEMLVCGEDLGMVPDCVPPVMNQLNILTLEIQRMPKNPKLEFAHPSDAPYLSVCTSSTHDMPTVRGWWEGDRQVIQRFYNQQLGNLGEAPNYAEPWVCQQIVTQHLHSSAMWAVFPVQDILAIDGLLRWEDTHGEQINVPSNVRHKWKYRMHQSIEDLLNAHDFNHLVKTLINEGGRNSDF